MNFVTLAYRNHKLATKKVRMNPWEDLELDEREAMKKAKESIKEEFAERYREAVELMLIAKEINEDLGLCESKGARRTYMITVRPENNKISFEDFYELVYNYVNRNCFEQYQLTFEQKGTTYETLGQGFHIHIVAKMTQRSKGEVLRDTISTFKSCTAPHCIQVDICKNPEVTVQKYLVNYESKDGHKSETKYWDQSWRNKLMLMDLYSDNLPPPQRRDYELENRLELSESVPYQVRSGTSILSFD